MFNQGVEILLSFLYSGQNVFRILLHENLISSLEYVNLFSHLYLFSHLFVLAGLKAISLVFQL